MMARGVSQGWQTPLAVLPGKGKGMAEVEKKPVKQATAMVRIIPDFSMSMMGGIHFDLGKEVSVSKEVIEKLKARGVKFKVL